MRSDEARLFYPCIILPAISDGKKILVDGVSILRGKEREKNHHLGVRVGISEWFISIITSLIVVVVAFVRTLLCPPGLLLVLPPSFEELDGLHGERLGFSHASADFAHMGSHGEEKDFSVCGRVVQFRNELSSRNDYEGGIDLFFWVGFFLKQL